MRMNRWNLWRMWRATGLAGLVLLCFAAAAHAQTEVTPGMENPCVANFGYQGCTPGGMPKPPGGPVDHYAVVAISPTAMDWGSAHAGTSLSDADGYTGLPQGDRSDRLQVGGLGQ